MQTTRVELHPSSCYYWLSSLTHYLKPSRVPLAVCWDMAGRAPGHGRGYPPAKPMMPVFPGPPGPPKAAAWPPRPAIMARPALTMMHGKAVAVTGVGVAPAVKLGGVPTNPVPAASVSTAMVPWSPSPPPAAPPAPAPSNVIFGFELSLIDFWLQETNY